MASSQDFPTSVIAKRVKALRTTRGLSAERLAERMKEIGVPFDKAVLANLETGRRRYVTVSELLALAYVLQVGVVHLIIDIDGAPDTPYEVAAGLAPQPTWKVREFIRGSGGDAALDGMDERLVASEVPVYEWRDQFGGRNPSWSPEIEAEVRGRRDGDR